MFFVEKVSDDLFLLTVFVLYQVLERTGEMPGQKAKGFTTVGKAKMATKQYNSPLAMYSEDIITEIMTQVNTNVVFLTAG